MMLFDLPPISSFTPDLSDEALAARLRALAAEERTILADFLVHLGEFDRRRLYLEAGFSSLFAWLTRHLGMANASAFRRVTACRLNLRMPAICAYLREGRITLTKLCLLKEVLAPESSLALLEQASQMTEKEVEELAAVLSGKTERAPRDSIRAITLRQESLFAGEGPKPLSREVAGAATSVPELTCTSPPVAHASAGAAPISPSSAAPIRHVVKMTVGPEFVALLDRVRAALSHKHPGASLETLLAECMKRMLAGHEKRAQAKTDRPRPAKSIAPGSRHIPAHVRRAVWERDQGRCTFVASDGQRCDDTHGLELHHLVPWARGGQATIEGMCLRCRPHNDLAARQDFGHELMDRFTRHPVGARPSHAMGPWATAASIMLPGPR